MKFNQNTKGFLKSIHQFIVLIISGKLQKAFQTWITLQKCYKSIISLKIRIEKFKLELDKSIKKKSKINFKRRG